MADRYSFSLTTFSPRYVVTWVVVTPGAGLPQLRGPVLTYVGYIVESLCKLVRRSLCPYRSQSQLRGGGGLPAEDHEGFG